MKTVGVRELRQNPAPAVAAASQGDVVVVTDRGRPVAQLAPVADTWLERAALAGVVRPATSDPRELPPPLERSTVGGAPLSEILAHMRESER